MNSFFLPILTLVLVMSGSTIAIAQKSGADLMRAAVAAFAGNDLSQKNGPLVKVGLDLALLREEYTEHMLQQPGARFTSSNSLLRVVEDKVVVDVVGRGDAVRIESELRSRGMKVTGKAGSVLSGLMPIASIESLAALDGVLFARPAMWATRAGLTTSQGDVSMESNIVRSSQGFNGAGITVGVLSDSYNYLGGAATDVASGDLPGTGNPDGFTTPVNVLAESGNTDEGRAMLQIIHDVAPGAALAFASANGGQATFANNITSLRTVAGADVIVDDIIYFAEPMFQDGVIAQAVDAAVAAGVPYFSAAGNEASKSYESVWRPGPVLSSSDFPPGTFFGGTSFDFDPGAGVDYMQAFTLGGGQTITLVFEWDSPFASVCAGCPGSSNDLDIYLLNAGGTQVLARGTTRNTGGDAFEYIQYTNQAGIPKTFNLLITKYSGSDPGFLKYINFGGTQTGLEFATNSSTIYGHANAAGASAVGAAAFYNTPAYGVSPPILEAYSSTGSTAIRFTTAGVATFDARAYKPEITAPDGVNTTFFGSDISQDADAYPNFFGTSAAAPHAAAVAALMLQEKPGATPQQIYSSLETTGIDMGSSGFDNSSGFGLIQAVPAMDAIVPIELASFTGTLVNANTVRLNWTTFSETNNYGFEVQRKGTSTGEFVTLTNGFVPGHGTTLQPQEYSFTDVTPEGGRWWYRLRQIDLDGTAHITSTVQVSVLTSAREVEPALFSLRQNFPNPCNPQTEIEFSVDAASRTTLIVYNTLGRRIAELFNDMAVPGQRYRVKFDGKYFASGLYFYTLLSGTRSETKKLLLLK